MCELFSMSSRFPATVSFSLRILAEHGGHTGVHKDGWGIAYYDGADVQLIRDTTCASNSRWVRFVEQEEINSTLVLSHIRKATEGEIALRNTQPFCRELGGCMHVFAHNGHVPGIHEHVGFRSDTYKPVGDTDSEHAFCALLERMKPLWQDNATIPELSARLDLVVAFASELRALGLSNFLYCDSDVIFAHGDRRKQIDGQFKAPGLYFLRRNCAIENSLAGAAGVLIAPSNQEVILVASVPLTAEKWEPVAEGEVIVVSPIQLMRRPAALH